MILLLITAALMSNAASLSPEEIAFAARLSDQERRAFVETLSAEQRSQMIARIKASSDLQTGIGEEQEMGGIEREVAEDTCLDRSSSLVDDAVEDAR